MTNRKGHWGQNTIIYWSVDFKPERPEDAPFSLFVYANSHPYVLSIGPMGRISGPNGAAMLESEELAEKLKDYTVNKIFKRYGNKSNVYVVQRTIAETPVYGPKTKAKIEEHSKKVKKLINQ